MESKEAFSDPSSSNISTSLAELCVGSNGNEQKSSGNSDEPLVKQDTQINAAQLEETTTVLRGTPSSSSPKLCGYLSKQAGPLKAWKSRWFVFEEKSCQLFYYRMAQDINPLGKVDLSQATFSFPLQEEEGIFHIQTTERTFILKAANREAQMYWLQQLQLKRASYRDQQVRPPSISRPDMQMAESSLSAHTCPADFLPLVKTPCGLVGEEAASGPASRINSPLNMSIKHPIIELQNTMHNLLHRHSQEIRQSVFHTDVPQRQSDTPKTGILKTSNSSQSSETPQNGLIEAHQASHDGKSVKEKSISLKSITSNTSHLEEEKLCRAEELKTQKEQMFLLHKVLEASQSEEQTSALCLSIEGKQERLDLLQLGEQCVVELQNFLVALQEENKNLRQDLSHRDAHVAELQENVYLLMQKNQAKQEVVLKLSEILYNDGDVNKQWICGTDSETLKHLTLENMHLKDDLKAYKTQNKFLNSEIYQLTTLWRKSSEQEKSLIVKCAVQEANTCQMERKYLGILQKIQESEKLAPEQQEAITEMIKDAIQADLSAAVKPNHISEYDEYGFKLAVDYRVDDLKLLAKIQALEVRSQTLLNQDECDGPLLARCTQLLSGRSEGELSSLLEIKSLLRSGLPHEYRPKVWRFITRTRTRPLRERYPERYHQLCEKSRTSAHLVPRQIQLDLDRTMTTNQHFCPPSSPLIQKLERVLQAFSLQNPTIGYVQGLNRLAAIILLVLQEEEDTFWCLVAIVEYIIPPDYYTKDLACCRADQRVLKDLMAEKLPRLVAHLDALKVDVSLITVEWFLVLFVENLPSSILLKVWDAFLFEGTKVTFRYALALFKYREENILKIQDSAEMYQYLRIFPNTIADGRKLTSIAFNDMNPLPMKLLRNRRHVHLELLHAEITEMENLQKAYKAESLRCKDKEQDIMASEDDEEM